MGYDFAPSPNTSALQLAGFGPINKQGWDEGAKGIVKRPVAAYVEKVYEQAPFAGLGL